MSMSPESKPPESLFSRIVSFLNADQESPLNEIETASGLLQKQISNSALTLRFCIVLALAAFIASLGLMVDSSVTVIGAMLIAPLMRPILSFAYGLMALRWSIIFRSLLTLIAGICITIIVAVICDILFNLHGPTRELLSRTHPTLIDLGVAVAAGLAATMATNRPNVADSLPGVAVAVALVPPLCVVGITLSNHLMEASLGALLLFTINLVAIILCAIFVYMLDGYGNLKGALPGAVVMILLLFVLSPTLFSSMKELSAGDQIQKEVVSYLRDRFILDGEVHPNDLSRIITKLHKDHISVFVEIEAPASSFDEAEIAKLYPRIEKLFDKPVNLKIQTVVTEEVKVYPFLKEDGSEQRYGADTLVPRKQ